MRLARSEALVIERWSFRFRFRRASGETGIGNAPALSDAVDGSCVGKTGECLAEAFVADAEACAEVGSREGSAGVREGFDHGVVERDVVAPVAVGRAFVLTVFGGRDNVEMDILVADEHEADGLGRGGSAMLDGEQELCAASADEQQRVRPREEVAGAAEALSGLASRAVLARVVHDEDGDVMRALQLTQITEQRRDLTGIILIDAVYTHKRIEHEKPRCVLGNGIAETGLVVRAIEPERGRGDEVDGKVRKVEAAVTADTGETRLDDGRGILGHVEQDGADVAALEDAETRRAARDRERHFESEPRFADLGGTAKDTDARSRPE